MPSPCSSPPRAVVRFRLMFLFVGEEAATAFQAHPNLKVTASAAPAVMGRILVTVFFKGKQRKSPPKRGRNTGLLNKLSQKGAPVSSCVISSMVHHDSFWSPESWSVHQLIIYVLFFHLYQFASLCLIRFTQSTQSIGAKTHGHGLPRWSTDSFLPNPA